MYTQGNRPLAVATPLGRDVLLLEDFQGHEAISELFTFQLHLLAENKTPVAFDQLLGHNVTVTLTLPGKQSRYFNGIVRRLTQGERDTNFTHYHAEVVPSFWLWTLKVESRIFQHLTIPDILKKVLAGLEVKYEFTGRYHPRDYCVQYRESDFAFASRLMEEEGIFYYFRHREGGHTLVVTDVPDKHPELPVQPQVIYDAVEGGTREETRVTRWEKSQEVRSGKYTTWDYCFELPDKNLEAQRGVTDAVAVGKVTHRLKVGGNDRLEIYDYPGGFAQRFDGVSRTGASRAADLQKIFEDNKRTARIRMEQETLPAVQVRGAGDCGHFVPGFRFTLTRHFDGDGPYLLTTVDHAAHQNASYRSGGDAGVRYTNHFTCTPAALAFRPLRATPRPTIPGTQTATVVGPKGQQVFVDKYGRVKVQFHWDRHGKKDANSSCWIRVAQTWAGEGWGAFFWPRVGHEVVVAFEDGDPDKPIIVGSVYNAANMPPFALPANKLINGIKSCSERGHPGKNYNGLVFYDKLGDEHVQIHSEQHQVDTHESSRHTHVGGTSLHVVGGFPGLSSGSGGQNDDDSQLQQEIDDLKNADQPGGDDQPASWKVQGKGWGQNLDLTFGLRFEGDVGIKFEQYTGGKMEFYLDPLAWLGQMGGAAAPAMAIGAWALLGKSEMKLCQETSLLYGTKVDIHRGHSVTYEVENPDAAWDEFFQSDQFVVALCAQLSMAASVILGAAVGTSKADDWLKQTCWIAFNLSWNLLMMYLTNLEAAVAYKQKAQKKLDDAQAQTELITKIVSTVTDRIAFPKWAAPIEKAVKDNTEAIAKLTKEMTKKVSKVHK